MSQFVANIFRDGTPSQNYNAQNRPNIIIIIIFKFLFRFQFIDSVFTWIDVSNCAKQWADPQGKEMLENQWNDASIRFNDYMEKGDQAGAFAMLEQVNNVFLAVAPHIDNPELRALFLKTYKDFSDILKTKNIPKINDYMINEHPIFKNAVEGN